MEQQSHFRSIEELTKVLNREKDLLKELFQRRKSLNISQDMALSLVEDRLERLDLLHEKGVVHTSAADVVELEDVYIRFFEDVLNMNEEISVASVKESMDELKETIKYHLEETNAFRKDRYLQTIKTMLRNIGLRTLKNVIDLKRNVEIAYKQEPNYKIKIDKLKHLDQKRINIHSLIKETENLIENEILFFNLASDPEMIKVKRNVRNNFTHALHNIIDIEKQIIRYLNQIERQSELYKKLKRIKYLKDQLTWTEDTNVVQFVRGTNDCWIEKKPYIRTLLSLERISTDEEIGHIIRKMGSSVHIKHLRRKVAEPLPENFLDTQVNTITEISTTKIWNAFAAQGSDLFNFICNYNYSQVRTINEHIILFCQLLSEHAHQIDFSGEFLCKDNIEFALVYASQYKENI